MLLLNPVLIVDGGRNQKFKVAAVQQFVEALVNFDTNMASNRHSLRATVAQWSQCSTFQVCLEDFEFAEAEVFCDSFAWEVSV